MDIVIFYPVVLTCIILFTCFASIIGDFRATTKEKLNEKIDEIELEIKSSRDIARLLEFKIKLSTYI
jgi:hypothetical protein